MNREVEIKCLLGTSIDAVTALVGRMQSVDPSCTKTAHNVLLNHYFNCENPVLLKAVADKLLGGDELVTLSEIIEKSGVLSVRTRQKNDKVLLIVKGVPAGGDAIHGIDRMEWENKLDISITELDQALVDAGLSVLAKWSGYKDVYPFLDVTIEVQFSPGYGYQVEIERVVEGDGDTSAAVARVKEVAALVGLQEVDHDLIGKMYDYYNANWQEYYATEKVFSPELLEQIRHS
jgi:adenylate cyclase class IV